MKIWKSLNDGKPVEGTLYFHYARLIETIYALERVRELLDDPDILGQDVANPQGQITGEGVGVYRGTARHPLPPLLWTDGNGVIRKVNMIVATAGNAWGDGCSVNMVAKRYVDGTA